MKRILLSVALLALMGQGCFTPPPRVPTPVPTPVVPVESSDQNMPPQDNTTPPPPVGTSTYNVNIQSSAFAPTSVSVRRGDKIIFLNRETVSHTITSDDGSFDSGTLAASRSWTFDTSVLAAGTYTYHCSIHPSMTATLIVR
ncbi:MAG: cupredoxin domain-containing protein [Candidatus Uhrbacteria bacterium]